MINKYIDPEWVELTCKHRPSRNTPAVTVPVEQQLQQKRLQKCSAINSIIQIPANWNSELKTVPFLHCQAAVENIWARFYGGIHFRKIPVHQQPVWKKVGDLVNTRIRMKK